jgi:hypothetical protein
MGLHSLFEAVPAEVSDGWLMFSGLEMPCIVRGRIKNKLEKVKQLEKARRLAKPSGVAAVLMK